MIGLDTNILVRYLTADDAKQHRISRELIEAARLKEEPIFLSAVVLCELVWVLEAAYELTRAEIVPVLEKVLTASLFEIEHSALAWNAVQYYRDHRGDFADYLLGLVHRRAGCRTTFSFDKALSGCDLFSLPSAK